MLKTQQSETLYDRACQSLATRVSTAFRHQETPVLMYFERGIANLPGGRWYVEATHTERAVSAINDSMQGLTE